MFTFHKPKVYRSTTGCCICKAKSSSSRFTDSKKYENDFLTCFQLTSPRQGEICNACVLLVKRFKRLPVGSARHWGHVVDARAGPGIKCMSKVKKRCEETQKSSKIDDCEGSMSGEEELWSEDEPASDDDEMITNKRRKLYIPRKNLINKFHGTHFMNRRIWKKMTMCCTDVWKNIYGQTILDVSSCRPCPIHIDSALKVNFTTAQECEGATLPGKVFNDNSSDSGYDEFGNSSPQDPNVVSNTNNIKVDNKNSTNSAVITHISGEKIPKISHLKTVCLMVSYTSNDK